MNQKSIAIVADAVMRGVDPASRFVPRRGAGSRRPGGGLRIALIEPRYDPSYYSQHHLLPLIPGDIRASHTSGALPLLAAFVLPPHEVTLFVENIEALDFARLAEFDVVGVTGMIVQRTRMLEILRGLADHPGIVVVGGPYASVDESFFNGLCDVLFAGEADTTWPQFLATVAADGRYVPRYEQPERTDMTTLPQPRFDLLPSRHYLFASLQFSRGCPFLCEFCDIITIFGRRPRAKTPEQLIAELATLRRAGFRSIFLVDDNFIGNKKLARDLLLALVVWQQANGHPLKFYTEATVNLADEPELLELMYQANFRTVFVGLETPNLESLGETRKVQNMRGDSMTAKVERIRDAGLVVEAGFMLGFDNDGPDIFERQFQFIRETRIARAGVGILTAIPSTPLFDRLQAEGRLRLDDPNCNFAPKLMSSAELRDGYLDLTRRIYEVQAFFERVFGVWASSASFRARWAARAEREHIPGWRQRMREMVGASVMAGRLAATLARDGESRLLGQYLGIWRQYRRSGVAGIGPLQYLQYAALHWHCYKFYKDARGGGSRIFNTYAFSRQATGAHEHAGDAVVHPSPQPHG